MQSYAMLSPRIWLLATLACYCSLACGDSQPPAQSPVQSPVTTEADNTDDGTRSITNPCGDQPCAGNTQQSDQPGLKINLPSGETREVDPGSNALVVFIQQDGQLMVNDKAIVDEDLERIFLATFTRDPNTQVILSADPGVGHALVVSVMDRAKKAGLSRLAISTSPDTLSTHPPL